MKIPGKGEVDRALKQAKREVKSALRQVNQLAGRLVAKGDYTGAQSWVEVGRAITTFGAEVDALHLNWQALHEKAPAAQISSERTPLWEYYRPILTALVELGGEATISDLEERVAPILATVLPTEEMVVLSGDKLRWKRTVRNSRRHMIKEGFLEDHSGPRWKITDSGRKAAEGPLAPKVTAV